MNRMLLLLCASLALPSLGGCLPELVKCDQNGATNVGRILDDFVCPAVCYPDGDGDGHGDVNLPREFELTDATAAEYEADAAAFCVQRGVEVQAELVADGDDCDDLDDNNFPGNREVCDGRDNDCTGDADFDVEGEEDQGDWIFSCTPADVVRIFLRGGSELNGQRIDATTSDIAVSAGTVISGTLKIRVLISSNLAGKVTGGTAASWAPQRRLGYVPFWNSVESPDDLTEAGWSDWDVPIPNLPTPEAGDDEADEVQYVSITAAASPDPVYVGSLTDPWYCCADCEPGTPPSCDPVWADEIGPGAQQPPAAERGGGGPPDDPPPIADGDVADLDELDMAACYSFGSARILQLQEAYNGPDRCEFTGTDLCTPVYRAEPLGCAFVRLKLDDEGGEAR